MDLIDRDNYREELKAQILRNNCDDFFPVSDEVNKGLLNAVILLDDMPIVDKWIPVSDPPKTTKHCIVACGGDISHYAYYHAPRKTFYVIGHGSSITCGELLDNDIVEPSYWMEMPEPPKDSILDSCCG